jgi:hypothetical protein
MTSTAAVWALTGALLLLAAVIGIVGYVWATTSGLDHLSERDVLAIIDHQNDDWAWPQLRDAERDASHDYDPGDDDRPTAQDLADDELPILTLPPEGQAA